MNLQQLRYLVAVLDNDLNITAAARALETSQPAVSRQIQLLEQELGVQLFERQGRALSRLTIVGERVISRAALILREVHEIRRTTGDLAAANQGTLSLATTHTQARYVLPDVIARFRVLYPLVKIHLNQGSSEQIGEMISKGVVDYAIATGNGTPGVRLTRLPLYEWSFAIVVPRDHALARKRRVHLRDISPYPLITYDFAADGASTTLAPFEVEGLALNIALTAQDADVIKTYVRIGLGVGLIAPFALEPRLDKDLVTVDVSHLLGSQISWIGFRRGVFLNSYMLRFIEMLAPHLSPADIKKAESGRLEWKDMKIPRNNGVRR